MIKIGLSLIAMLASQLVFAGQVAIVIDDIGYKPSDKKLFSIDANLTYAVLPHTPFGYRYAKLANQKDRDVILHLPMQAQTQNELLGPGALKANMAKGEYQQTLLSALEDIPFAVGINNHMGSLLTQLDEPMSWTMEVLQQHNLFFLDSKTTNKSRIEPIGHEFGVKTLDRNIFLDHIREPKAMAWQFRRLIKMAKRNGSAIAIGHPYPETYQFLKDNLIKLEEAGIKVVPLSEMLYPSDAALADNKSNKADVSGS